jgi:aminomethyltransferase
MPVQYTGIVDEHLAVRGAAGVFDISHMGEVLAKGPGAEPFLNHTLRNDLRKLETGQGQYTLLCNERGGVIDDLYAYRLAPESYLLIVNASRTDADFDWLQRQQAAFQKSEPFELRNASAETGAVAVQGPRVVEFIGACFPGPSRAGTAVSQVTELQKNRVGLWAFGGQDVWVSRTGYTGEDGFEVVAPAAIMEGIWTRLLEFGKASGLKPAGLGARDTLRTEVCYPLYGHELDEVTTPLEAGLGFFVALDKGDFLGRPVLLEQKAKGVTKKLVAFRMQPKSAPPRPRYLIFQTGEGSAPVGAVASGTQSPSLGVGIGTGYVPPEIARPQTEISIETRGRRYPALIVPKPIYRKTATG